MYLGKFLDVAEEGQWRRVVELRLQFSIALSLYQLHLQGGRPRESQRGGKQLEVRRQRSDSCETGGKFLTQRGDDTNASVRLHVIGYTSSNQLHLPQSQLYLEGCDVCVLVCYEDVFALQLHVRGVRLRHDVRQQG